MSCAQAAGILLLYSRTTVFVALSHDSVIVSLLNFPEDEILWSTLNWRSKFKMTRTSWETFLTESADPRKLYKKAWLIKISDLQANSHGNKSQKQQGLLIVMIIRESA